MFGKFRKKEFVSLALFLLIVFFVNTHTARASDLTADAFSIWNTVKSFVLGEYIVYDYGNPVSINKTYTPAPIPNPTPTPIPTPTTNTSGYINTSNVVNIQSPERNTTQNIIEKSSPITYVTNNYPTTIIRETIQTSGGGSTDTSHLVSKTFFDLQLNGIFNSLEDSASGISAAISEGVTTAVLTVSGDATIGGDITITGNITGNVIGTINPSFTLGSVSFQGLTGLEEDNANFFWDDTNNRLGLGDVTPSYTLDVTGTGNFTGALTALTFNGNTIPLGSDTVVTLTSTQTLTNKTFTAPKFADLGFIADANGNELIILDTVASAVNELTVTNAVTGSGPTISATGGGYEYKFES